MDLTMEPNTSKINWYFIEIPNDSEKIKYWNPILSDILKCCSYSNSRRTISFFNTIFVMRLPLPLKHYFKQHHFEERFWVKFSLCTKGSFTNIVRVILLMKAIIWILCLNEYLTWHLKFKFMTDLITIHNRFFCTYTENIFIFEK